jgi:hypothetical protein
LETYSLMRGPASRERMTHHFAHRRDTLRPGEQLNEIRRHAVNPRGGGDPAASVHSGAAAK